MLNDISIKKEYRSQIDNVVVDFYLPLLKEAVVYKRAVGFFSSTALVHISKGICGLVENGGKIQLIVSPNLSDEDIQAMRLGYSEREKVLKHVLFDSLNDTVDIEGMDRLNLLANLIADDILDIKVALTNSKGSYGMYHEKLGIISDKYDNKVAFSGSANESATAMMINYEAIDVFCSWKDDNDIDRVKGKESAFNSLWNNTEPNVTTIDFPELKDEIIKRYKQSSPDFDLDSDYKSKNSIITNTDKNIVQIPSYIKLYDYQEEAIREWENNNYRGIFDMATGTGKTLTGLSAVTRLYETLNGKLTVVIVCPFQHLVEQWVEDIIEFNMNPIIGYSSSSQKDWKKRLDTAIRGQKLNVSRYDFICFICTNATYSCDFVQQQINKVKTNALLLVDEAHNFGSLRLRKLLPDSFNFRLALSATLERHRDEEGTEALKAYFGEKCIIYSLDRAIEEKKLTPYKYYPVIVYLNEDELEIYESLTRELSRCLVMDKQGNMTLNERGKKIALKRARLVAGAKSKIDELKNLIYNYRNDKHLLVYCGATKLLEDTEDTTEVDSDELRQIDVVTNMLYTEYGMKVSQFTSKEDINERAILKNEFALGDRLQALIAIKCLDEGVNIPAIKVAFILASTTNPKEYIQRRGRLLRKYEGKEFAEIYDFITLPRPLENVTSLTSDEMNKDMTLVKNEITRAEEFARISMNFMYADSVISRIKNIYKIDE